MSWTSPRDIKAQLSRLWGRGKLLRSLVTDEKIFPLRLTLKGPSSTDVTERFEAVRAWTAELSAMPHLRIEWREINHRVQGMQRLPQSIWVDTLDDALQLLKKQRDAQRFMQLVDVTRSRLPLLLPWLAQRPLQAIDLADQWLRLLAVVHWLMDHPRPGIYLRQVDIPGVHSKFIEAHQRVLSELFDLALPGETIAVERTGVSHFAARYGFLAKPVRIRLRVLDKGIPLLQSAVQPDIMVDADSFSRLKMPLRCIFITENETNFLAFPAAAEAIVIFGAGYGWDALTRATWLTRCTIHYWGDIDTHGFAILNQLRSYFKHVSSFLMDRETLMAHETHWGEEVNQTLHDLPHLTPKERALFDDLRDNRIRKNLRLEQEHIGFHWVMDKLQRVVNKVN
jgi:hypothetical protein